MAYLPSSTGAGVQQTITGSFDAFVLPGIEIVSTNSTAIILSGDDQAIAVFGVVSGTTGILLGDADSNLGTQVLTVGKSGQVIGEFAGVQMRGDHKSVINSGEIVGAYGDGIRFSGASGMERVQNTGSVSGGKNGINLLSGSMSLSLVNTGTISGLKTSLSFGAGDDRVVNRGNLNGDALLYDGANKFYNYAAVNGDVKSGLGSDLIVNRSFIGGSIDTGQGNDTVINRALIEGNLASSGAFGTLDNRGGTISGTVTFGSGSDVINNRGGTIVGDISLGGGNDRFVAGSATEHVDGGLGTDTLDLSIGGSVVFGLAPGSDRVGLLADSTYTGFENVIGSKIGTNTLIGDSGNNQLEGGRSVDTLAGGAGDDVLYGNAGKDALIGGTGADVVVGGAGADAFVFAAGDIATGATNDRILDFTQIDKDRVDLSAIDANSVLDGDQAFAFIGNSAFTSHAGELRFVSGFLPGATPATFIQGDTNGDGVADWSIALDGTITLLKGDFLL